MRLPRLYQGRNGFLVVVAATVWMAGCQNDLPVSPVVPNPESQSLDASTRDGESFERYVLVIPDAPNQVPDAAPPPGPDAPPAPPVVCGDGILNVPEGEQCDDGNTDPADGCGSTCLLDEGWICPEPNKPCVNTTVCGDGTISGAEKCDDNNTNSGDGCSADCKIEDGWTCPTAGSLCQAAECGDGLMVGSEACDDGNTANGDGCSSTCHVEPGYFCPTPGAACQKTVCGNGVVEGDEGCDDGNELPWDGCSPTCEREPTCTNGECASVCGDGMILAGDVEECDDGNQRDGDGCSSTCTKEPGWDCPVTPIAAASQLSLPVVFRDFISFPTGGSTQHPNFEDNIGTGVTTGLVQSTLGSDSKPVYGGICDSASVSATACPHGRQLTTQADFDQWYRDTPVSVRGDSFITLALNTTGQYVFNGGTPANPFLPFGRNDLTGVGWVAQGKELLSGGGDFGFTTEVHYWFQLQGGERLDFSGDDDVWVFFKNALLIDLGGRHAATAGTINLTDAEITNRGLTKGRIYEIALFHAERHTNQSNFQLTLNGFGRSKSVCTPICGDGIVVKGEVCDDGPLNGTYGHCNETCTGLGPHCGDNVLQADQGEECDDGVNLTTYGINGKPGCAPGCKWSPFCGDGKTDSLFGEQCDTKGVKLPDSSCQLNCTYRPSCGNGVVDKEDGETCDDGNTISGDGCSSFCTWDIVQK
jgi:fibro-slime domain-containing protein